MHCPGDTPNRGALRPDSRVLVCELTFQLIDRQQLPRTLVNVVHFFILVQVSGFSAGDETLPMTVGLPVQRVVRSSVQAQHRTTFPIVSAYYDVIVQSQGGRLLSLSSYCAARLPRCPVELRRHADTEGATGLQVQQFSHPAAPGPGFLRVSNHRLALRPLFSGNAHGRQGSPRFEES